MKSYALLIILTLTTFLFMPANLHSQQSSAVSESARLSAIFQRLHQNPEGSGKEFKTASIILEYLKESNADVIYTDVGGHGIIARFKGKRAGESKMFRCELDAVISEDQPSHLCGHDGHMTILLGLAGRLSQNRNFPGEVFILFQPAEETGEGAARMVADITQKGLKFDTSFALHNRPGIETGTVIIAKETYAAASVGLELRFKGRDSHAATPELALSPVDIIFETIAESRRLNEAQDEFPGFVLSTVVNVEIGDVNYGVTPGEGFLRFTLRGFRDQDLALLFEKITSFASQKALGKGFELSISEHDRFPATINSSKANKVVAEAAEKLNMKIIYTSEPERGSDDFCHFSRISESSYFDIGNGSQSEGLHQRGYRFSQEIIIPAVNLLSGIIY